MERWRPCQAPLLAPQRPPAEAPAGASRGVSSPVGWEEPTLQGRPLVGSDGRGLQGSVPPQAEPNCQAGRAAVLRQWRAPLAELLGAVTGTPPLVLQCRLLQARPERPSLPGFQGPTCPAGTP